jgi:hypothetical protein
MTTSYYVYKHPSTFEPWQGMTYEKCLENKILIGVRSAGPLSKKPSEREMHFTWAINPFKFMEKYYGDFYWIVDEHGNAMHCYAFACMFDKTAKVTYEGDFLE